MFSIVEIVIVMLVAGLPIAGLYWLVRKISQISADVEAIRRTMEQQYRAPWDGSQTP